MSEAEPYPFVRYVVRVFLISLICDRLYTVISWDRQTIAEFVFTIIFEFGDKVGGLELPVISYNLSN